MKKSSMPIIQSWESQSSVIKRRKVIDLSDRQNATSRKAIEAKRLYEWGLKTCRWEIRTDIVLQDRFTVSLMLWFYFFSLSFLDSKCSAVPLLMRYLFRSCKICSFACLFLQYRLEPCSDVIISTSKQYHRDEKFVEKCTAVHCYMKTYDQ